MAEKKATSTKGAAAAKKAEPAKKAATAAKAEPTKAAAKKAEPAKKAAAAAKAEPTKTEAKKAEPAKKAATAAKAEPTKAAAKKAEPAKKAATTAKAELTKAAAKKAEPAKKAATAAKAEPTKVAAKKAEPAKKAATAAKAEPTKVAAKKEEPIKATAKKDVQEKSEAKTKSFAQRATSNKKSDKEVGAALATSSVEPSKKQSARKAPTMVADKKEEKKSRMSSSKSDGGAGATRAISLDKNKKIIIICVAAVACLAILLTMILSIKSCTSGGKGNYDRPYMSTTEVGFAAEYLGEVERNIPTEMKDGGLEQGYPKYGYTQKLTQEQKQAVIAESWQLCSIDTRIGSDGYPKNTFNAMDKDGNLILNGVATGKKLYKHSASVGMYMGDVDNNEPAISKNIYIRPRHSNSYSLTGMFAPAGEVIKIEMSEEDMDATSGILVHIGQALYNKKANNIWPAKNVNRMPVILNSMKVNKSTATYDENTKTYTAYVGSFLGGPIYIHNTSVAINVKVSGGVRYTHFIHGYTTEEEFKENAKSSAPYFDLEVWDGGVLHSGPKSCAGISTYEEAKKAGVLWEKISLVSNYARKKREGIVFLYDPFVAAGAAVAFPSQQSVNCPAGWMSGSLKVDSFIKTGAWGNMHEYNHNFQGFGVGNGGEVTNNALNILEYSWFTHISSARNITSYGGGGLSGWNCYTSATWAADQVINGRYSNGKQGLAIYANLLHNFGQEAYVEMIRNSGGQSYDTWFNACMNTTHNDMTYYYKDLIGYNVSQSVLDNAKSKNYPLFIPMASVYQTGRSYVYDGEKKYFNTQQPYVIKYGEEFEIDLSKYTVNSAGMYQSGSVVIPDRFNYTVKKVASQDKLNGSITKKDDWNYVFKPNKEIKSGKIIVTLEVKDTQGVYTNIDDVDLILEFEQSHEMNKNVVERTTYTYAAGAGYTDAVAAYEAGYAGYTDKVEGDSINKVQNSNTDVWYTNKNGDNCPENGIVEVRGKLHVGADGKYRIALRGRWNIALYIKVNDEENYRLVASSKTATETDINNKNLPHVDLDFKKDDWVYFKEVMVTSTVGNRASFIGLAFNKFEDATPLFDENGEIVGEVSGDVDLSYAVGYRESYESINKDFETEYHYKRDNVYSYVYNKAPKAKQSIVSSQGYTPYDANRDKIENLVDGNLNTYIHTKGGVSAKNPLMFTVDLGEVVSANKMYINTQYRPNGDYRYASDFILQGSVDGQNFTDLATVQDAKLDASHRVSVDFALTEMRYYRLIITKSTGGNVIITRIDFSEHYEQLSGIQYSIDNEMMKYGKGWKAKSVASSYGHVVVGKKGATVEFTFEGNKLALLSSSAYNNSFEVTIDGKKINTELFKNLDRDRIVMAFLSPQLSQGKHKVKIKCTKKNTALDSIVVWQQKEEAAK